MPPLSEKVAMHFIYTIYSVTLAMHSDMHSLKNAYSCHRFVPFVPFCGPSLLFLKLEAVLNIIKYALAHSIMYPALYLAWH